MPFKMGDKAIPFSIDWASDAWISLAIVRWSQHGSWSGTLAHPWYSIWISSQRFWYGCHFWYHFITQPAISTCAYCVQFNLNKTKQKWLFHITFCHEFSLPEFSPVCDNTQHFQCVIKFLLFRFCARLFYHYYQGLNCWRATLKRNEGYYVWLCDTIHNRFLPSYLYSTRFTLARPDSVTHRPPSRLSFLRHRHGTTWYKARISQLHIESRL